MSTHGLCCPGCGTVMDGINVRDVPLDRCPECLGMWFDAGEFAESVRCQVPPLQVKQPSARRCARCDEAMHLATLGPAVVDWCEPCCGLFLDVGEYDIIRQGRAPVPTKAFDRWQDPYRRDADDFLPLTDVGLIGWLCGPDL